jgi:hypothetical protein
LKTDYQFEQISVGNLYQIDNLYPVGDLDPVGDLLPKDRVGDSRDCNPVNGRKSESKSKSKSKSKKSQFKTSRLTTVKRRNKITNIKFF